MRSPRGVIGAVSGALLAGLVVFPGQAEPAPSTGRPNVLVIVTDDQRAGDTLDVMPETRRRFAGTGTTFTNAFVTTPLCCPSRAAIMSGRYGHNNGVRTNEDGRRLDQGTTLQRRLHDAGYQTAIAGKFLLHSDLSRRPAFFDRSAVTNGTEYYGATFSVDGRRQKVDRYSTHFIGERAVDFLDEFEREDERPWFLYVAPQAPHRPYVAEPRYADAPVPIWRPGAAVSEADRSDKPPFVTDGARSTPEQAEAERKAMLRTLMSVDDLVASVFEHLERLGESNTLAIFTSDNGYFWAEHGLRSKSLPYTEAVAVPLLVRWPGRIAPGRTDARLAATVDVVPTVLSAAGIVPSGPPLDGRSLLRPPQRQQVFIEYHRDPAFPYPTWASLRGPRFQYIEYYDDDRDPASHTGGQTAPAAPPSLREYYDLTNDPAQLTNLFGDDDPSNDPDVSGLSGALARYRACAGSTGRRACP